MAGSDPSDQYSPEPNLLERKAAEYLQQQKGAPDRLERRPVSADELWRAQLRAIIWAAGTGIVSGAIIGGSELFVREGLLSGEDNAGWGQQLPYWAGFFALAGLISAVEILALYWIALRGIARISRIAGIADRGLLRYSREVLSVAYTMLLKRDRRSGRYHFRMQVPDDLRPLLGWEIKRSLMTTDLKEAKRRYPAALEWAQGRLDAARQQLQAQAVEVDIEQLEADYEASVTPEWRQLDYAIRHGGRGDPSLPEQDLAAEPEKWRRPFRSTPLAKLLKIEHPPSPDQLSTAAKATGRAAERTEKPAGVTLGGIFNAWLAERKPPDRTRYEWQRAIDALARQLGYSKADELPATGVTRQALVAWKADLLAQGKSGKTTKNRIDVIHALFNYAVDNALVTGTNPAHGVRVAARQDPAARRLPYSEADAQLILAATRREPADKPSKRWLPWLLLFTGARLDEVCQLRKEDIREDAAAGWYMAVHHGAPGEGRRLKNLGSARKVPLHRQVIEEGFIEYVATLPTGSSLWPDLKPDRFGSRGGTATKQLGRWVRSLGITDPRKVLHSARHRFKDVCRGAGIPKDVHDTLTGHVAGDVGSTYGLGHNLATLREAVDRLPAVALPGLT